MSNIKKLIDSFMALANKYRVSERWREHFDQLFDEIENPQLGIGAASTRYFFVCTVGKNPNGSIGFNNFDIQTTSAYPTLKRCIELSNERFPNMQNVALISISEISSEDWKVFVSE